MISPTTPVSRAPPTLLRAATSAPVEGRALYAALRALPVPEEPMARLWHAATLLREHRGDGHTVALVAEGVGGTEAHVLHALSVDMPAKEFGRVGHLAATQLAAVIGGMRARGLVGTDGRLTDAGRATKERVEALTGRLAEAYDALSPSELDRLAADLRAGLGCHPGGRPVVAVGPADRVTLALPDVLRHLDASVGHVA